MPVFDVLQSHTNAELREDNYRRVPASRSNDMVSKSGDSGITDLTARDQHHRNNRPQRLSRGGEKLLSSAYLDILYTITKASFNVSLLHISCYIVT